MAFENPKNQTKIKQFTPPILDIKGERVTKEQLDGANSFILVSAKEMTSTKGDADTYYICEAHKLHETEISFNFTTTPTMTNVLKDYLKEEKNDPLPCEIKVEKPEGKEYYTFVAP